MNSTKLKWYQRFQIQVGLTWSLFPTREMTWKSWAFDPNYGCTFIGQEITDRYQLPESYFYGVDILSITETEKIYKSLVFYFHGALRLFGLDFGIGIFYRKRAPLEPFALRNLKWPKPTAQNQPNAEVKNA